MVKVSRVARKGVSASSGMSPIASPSNWEVPVVFGSDLVGLISRTLRIVGFTASLLVGSGRCVSRQYAGTEIRNDSSRFPRPELTIQSSVAQKLSSFSIGLAMLAPGSRRAFRKSTWSLSMPRCPCAVVSSLEVCSVIIRRPHHGRQVGFVIGTRL